LKTAVQMALENNHQIKAFAYSVSASRQDIRLARGELLPKIAIEENLTDYQIDDRAPFTLWTVMTQIARAGDASGNRWSLGVDAKRHVNYGLTSTEVAYHLRRGLLYNVSSSEYEPYLVEPGWAQLDDVPTGPESLTTNANDVARRIYLEECEFIAPDGLKFKRTADYGN